MSPPKQPSGLKRGLPPSIESQGVEVLKKHKNSSDNNRVDSARIDRSRLSRDSPPPPRSSAKRIAQLPSPLTRNDTSSGVSTFGTSKEVGSIVTPEADNFQLRASVSPARSGISASQTQPFSQLIYPSHSLAYEVDNEEAEKVWAYLVPRDGQSAKYGTLVLRDRTSCSPRDHSGEVQPLGARPGEHSKPKAKSASNQESESTSCNSKKPPSKGYLIGRHQECDLRIDAPTISNRHCLIFSESRDGHTVAILEDISANGTLVNGLIVTRNERKELHDGDEINILQEASFCFRYARHRESSTFKQQYTILEQLGRGHFASVYLCVDRATSSQWAVKKFEKPKEEKKLAALHQEIAVLMAISHPSLVCLKGAFDEADGIYLILELAPKGELFNHIIQHKRLSEEKARHVFNQLFQAVKYLHIDCNIVHRDIKPENILLADNNLSIKLADFGLAKIVGDESFTSTLCGTPSYVAPEMLIASRDMRGRGGFYSPGPHRLYNFKVDIWSLGVVLYICLCGFPPFSDELYTKASPYSLPDQIILGRFDFPSPYWDDVDDKALVLIEQMLTVDPTKRIGIEDCLDHPWVTEQDTPRNSQANESMLSTDGLLAGKLNTLDFSKRRPKRERTLLSDLNKIVLKQVTVNDGKEVPCKETTDDLLQNDSGSTIINVFSKNPQKRRDSNHGRASPDSIGKRFLAYGEVGDPVLLGDEDSMYSAQGSSAIVD